MNVSLYIFQFEPQSVRLSNEGNNYSHAFIQQQACLSYKGNPMYTIVHWKFWVHMSVGCLTFSHHYSEKHVQYNILTM